MKKRLALIALVLLLSFAAATPALAQDYSFTLDKEIVNVYWNSDGSVALDYVFVFTNNAGGHAIDFVDVGMPNGRYNINNARADVDGKTVNISSDYQGDGSYGFAVDLGAYAIQPGRTGAVHVYISGITDVMYPDSKDSNYASAVFAPTWFGSQYVTGVTELSVIFHLPPGVKPEEPRWHSAPSGFPSEPQTALDNEGRVAYTWTATVRATKEYDFGASFPNTYIPATAVVQSNPLEDLFGVIGAFFTFIASSLPCLVFAAFFFGIPVFSVVNAQRRKLKYLPPKISIEGHGIKRGLTAVEAAILMEQPLDKVMTMILFGVIKKGAAEVVTRDPLELAFATAMPEGLHEYEKDFLKAFGEKKTAARRRLLQDMSIALVRSVSDKMKGFSRKETVDYYKGIMERAWAQVELADTPEVKSQKFDENLEWTMLDKDYDDRSRRAFTGPVFIPSWWERYDPAYRPVVGTSSSRPVSIPTSSGSARPLPGAQFAASVIGGAQNFSSKVIGDVQAFTSKVTGVTNPPPPPSVSSTRSGGGGGHSCACACACAGCACACAGGGR